MAIFFGISNATQARLRITKGPESYAIKDALKARGWRYDDEDGWSITFLVADKQVALAEATWIKEQGHKLVPDPQKIV